MGKKFGWTGLLLLASCNAPDWRAKAAQDGEQKVRDDLGDPSLEFSAVQVVGDSRTGQVCGKVLGKTVYGSVGEPVRFIVYIDGSAGPWIEGQHGRDTVSDSRFDFAWQNDCINEGWRAP